MNLDFWANKNILITGHTGFKGSWLSVLLNHLGANVYGLSDKKKDGIYEVIENSNILKKEFFHNINRLTKEEAKNILEEIKPDIVFHFAAQSLVYEGYLNPLDTIETNILGTYKIMSYVEDFSEANVLTISTTDKVYLNPEIDNTEENELGGKDFYSASKAGAEFVISAFLNSKKREGLNITVIRSGNVIGGGDRGKYRLMTDVINSINSNETFELRKPNSIRPWQFVLDSLWGYLIATYDSYNKNKSDIYNLNSKINNKYTAQKLVETYFNYWKDDLPEIKITNEMFKEVDKLTINSSKAKNNLNWEPIYNVDKTIDEIVQWEKNFEKEKDLNFTVSQIKNYIHLAN